MTTDIDKSVYLHCVRCNVRVFNSKVVTFLSHGLSSGLAWLVMVRIYCVSAVFKDFANTCTFVGQKELLVDCPENLST